MVFDPNNVFNFRDDIFMRCIKCNEVMVGIRSYDTRKVCSDCGGMALRNSKVIPDAEKAPA